ncbi:unnamed protein product [Brassicogethes aeneus]|uniref:Uncharacterized protein n=1 Tax=Brassicogethes aeneus TaxID=1431903 RepID=A0A9P0FNV3_BRAAE|nr:unnamed protein product [Brassicogethes aeneus]
MKSEWKKFLRNWKFANDGQEIKKYQIPSLLNDILEHKSFVESIKKGFKVCGLFPFTADNVDYTKCTKQVDNHNNDTEIFQEEIVNDGREGFLPVLESKIGAEMLRDFRECKRQNKQPDNESAGMLYNVWLQFNRSENTTNIIDTHQAVTDIFDFPFPEWNEVLENVSVEDHRDEAPLVPSFTNDVLYNMDINEILAYKTDLTTNSQGLDEIIHAEISNTTTSNFNQGHGEITEGLRGTNTELQDKLNGSAGEIKHTNDQVMTKLISENEDSNKKQHRTELVIEGRNNDLPRSSNIVSGTKNTHQINILSNILVYPSTSNISAKKKRKVDAMPSVLTSTQWVTLAEKKEQEKLEAQNLKEERKRKREESKILLAKKKKNTKRMKKQQSEIKDNQENYENEKLQVDLSHTDNVDDSVELTDDYVLKKGAKDFQTHLKKNTYVIVNYDTGFYPGKILKVKPDGYFIAAMEKSGVQHWKWPDKKDQLLYQLCDIHQIINKPKKINNRGAFMIKEMEEYNKTTYE